jgi:hypothetical protein
MEKPPQPGSDAQLWIEGFGVVPIRIVHVGPIFLRRFDRAVGPAPARLLDWLMGEIAAGGPAAAVR